MSDVREVEIEVRAPSVKQMVSVTFPLYRASGDSGEHGEWESCTRIGADLSSVTITRRRGWHEEWEWGLTTAKRVRITAAMVDLAPHDFEGASKATEFDKLLAEFREALTKV